MVGVPDELQHIASPSFGLSVGSGVKGVRSVSYRVELDSGGILKLDFSGTLCPFYPSSVNGNEFIRWDQWAVALGMCSGGHNGG